MALARLTDYAGQSIAGWIGANPFSKVPTCVVPKAGDTARRQSRPISALFLSSQHNCSPFPAACPTCDAVAVTHTAQLGGDSGSGGGSRRLFTCKLGDNGDGDGENQRLHWLQQLVAATAAVLLPTALLATPHAAAAATAASKRSNVQQQDHSMISSWQLDAFVDRMWDLSGPILNNMGFSGILGACAAAALKWVGRTLAASLGMGLIVIQVLSHYNIITVNWSVVHQQARQVLDTTGTGRLDQDTFKRVVKQGLVVLSEGVPSLSGFLVGFLLGLKVF